MELEPKGLSCTEKAMLSELTTRSHVTAHSDLLSLTLSRHLLGFEGTSLDQENVVKVGGA